ncbi:MAG: hypothetical protein H0V17_17725, partial [Deltaproteobacteria bacterium]|nr:hypothetical protein [Deltaproteobacteria bacterium]
MQSALAFALLLAGCFPTPSAALVCSIDSDCADGRTCESGFCVSSTDAGVEPDTTEVTPDGAAAFDCTPFTTRLFAGCDIPEPGAAIDVTSGITTYNTDTGALSTGTSPPSIDVTAGHVISVQKITIAAGATLRVTGSKPLILASWSTIQVDGTIDVSSTATELGAGANPTGCTAHAPIAGEANDNGAGGGGGGSMVAIGGRGGNGDNGDGAGGIGGTSVAAPLLLGGCAGATGGTG